MPHLLDRDVQVHGGEVRIPVGTHAEALKALRHARTADELARQLARDVLTLNPTSGELGEGKARNMQDLAMRYLATVA